MTAVLFSFLSVPAFATEGNGAIAENETISKGCHSLDAASAYLGVEKKTDNVSTAFLYEVNSDTMLYAWNADQKIFPSSLVKVLTALIAVEKGNLQDVVTVTQDALDSVPYYAASVELQVDEQITLENLLYCMMVGSANDAAAVIASHISGSQAEFVQEMNNYAASLGCTSTQFLNPHGLHDEGQYTTTRDMMRILAAAVKNDNFLKFFSEISYVVLQTNKSAERDLSSGNFLMNVEKLQLYYDSRVIGGRTGVTEDGARCLATLAEQNGMRVICLVTGSKSTFAEDGNTLTYGSFQETSVLLDACFKGYQVTQVLYEDQILKQIEIENGDNNVVLGSQVSAYCVLPEGVTLAELNYRYTDVFDSATAPIAAGQILSNVQIWYGGICVAQTDLVAMNSVNIKQIQQAQVEFEEKSVWITVLIVVLSVLIGIVFILFLIRFARKIHMLRVNRRRKEYRRSRRRSR